MAHRGQSHLILHVHIGQLQCAIQAAKLLQDNKKLVISDELNDAALSVYRYRS